MVFQILIIFTTRNKWNKNESFKSNWNFNPGSSGAWLNCIVGIAKGI